MNTFNSNLDNTDWKILAELQKDARISYAELGRRVGLSSPAVQERVRKLEDMGIIEGYQARVNYHKLGLPIMAITRLTDMRDYDTIEHVAKLVETVSEVIGCYKMTGQDEFMLIIRAQSMEHLTTVLRQFSPFSRCVTGIVLRTPVSHRVVSLDEFPFLAKE